VESLWFSIVANTSIVGMNLSLMLNSVGFYQISKVEHDSRGLCDGVDSSQQELYQIGQDNYDCCGYWCWCLHCHRCEGQSQRVCVCCDGCITHFIATNFNWLLIKEVQYYLF
jgi:hypothetical protein